MNIDGSSSDDDIEYSTMEEPSTPNTNFFDSTQPKHRKDKKTRDTEKRGGEEMKSNGVEETKKMSERAR